MTTIIVAGALATKAGNAGNAWTRLAWAGGFARLGCDVWVVEQLHDDSGSDSASLDWARRALDVDGLGDRLAVLDQAGRSLLGPPASDVCDLLADCELLLNIGGHLSTVGLGGIARTRVFLDDDPGFTQIWEVTGSSGSRMQGHHVYCTYAANLASGACRLPTCGVHWHAVRPPVLLDHWPPANPEAGAVPPGAFAFTTVARWRGPFGALSWQGRTYPLKHHEFRRVINLPDRVTAEFELALDIDDADAADRSALNDRGWRTVASSRVAGDLPAYRRYIQSSSAEFSAAQGVYVQAATGWISDRTACYLASGRPALVQDTGMGASLPVGDGLVPWDTMESAQAGAWSILADYKAHSGAARALAETYFDARSCAAAISELAGVAP